MGVLTGSVWMVLVFTSSLSAVSAHSRSSGDTTKALGVLHWRWRVKGGHDYLALSDGFIF